MPESGPPSRLAFRLRIDQHALFQMHDAACFFRGFRIVRHHQDRLAELAIEPIEQRQYFLAGRAVEIAGRLVGDDQRRIGDQRTRDRHALLLSAGELVGIDGRRDRRDRPATSAMSTRSRRSRRDRFDEQQRQLDVLERGQHRHQVVELEDEADVRRAPRARDRASDRRAMSTPPTLIVPLDGLSMPAMRFSSVALAGAGRPHQRDEVAELHIEVEIDQHRDDLLAALVVLR